MREQKGFLFHYTYIVKLTFPLKFDQVFPLALSAPGAKSSAHTVQLMYHHSWRKRHGTADTYGRANGNRKFVYCSGLGAITVYIEAVRLGQIVLATVAPVHYLHPINLLHMQQPYQSLIAVLVLNVYLAVGIRPIESRCRNR